MKATRVDTQGEFTVDIGSFRNPQEGVAGSDYLIWCNEILDFARNDFESTVSPIENARLSYLLSMYTWDPQTNEYSRPEGGHYGVDDLHAALSLLVHEKLDPDMTLNGGVVMLHPEPNIRALADSLWEESASQAGPYTIEVLPSADSDGRKGSVTVRVNTPQGLARSPHIVQNGRVTGIWIDVEISSENATFTSGEGRAENHRHFIPDGNEKVFDWEIDADSAETIEFTAGSGFAPGPEVLQFTGNDRFHPTQNMISRGAPYQLFEQKSLELPAPGETSPPPTSPSPEMALATSSQVSTTIAKAGDTLTDTVKVWATSDQGWVPGDESTDQFFAPVTVVSQLFGPFPDKPTAQDSIPDDASLVNEFAQQVMPQNGALGNPASPAEFTTPPVEITAPGYYTWVEKIAAEPGLVSTSWQSPFGQDSETLLVQWQPRVETVSSDTETSVGSQIHDTLAVFENKPNHQLTINSVLWGPFAEQPTWQEVENHSIDPTEQPIPEQATQVCTVSTSITGNGHAETPACTVAEPGYYVWTETISETTHTTGWVSDFGVSAETTFVKGQESSATPSHPADTSTEEETAPAPENPAEPSAEASESPLGLLTEPSPEPVIPHTELPAQTVDAAGAAKPALANTGWTTFWKPLLFLAGGLGLLGFTMRKFSRRSPAKTESSEATDKE